VKFSQKNIQSKDVLERNTVFNVKGKFDPSKNPAEFQKEFGNTHWLAVYLDKVWLWYRAPFRLRIWNTDKDTELGRFSWDTNAYSNSLSNILYRNEKLQSRSLMNFMVNRLDHRSSLEVNKAEEPPKISPNSVFLYRDSSYKIVNKVLNPIHILLITNPYTYTHGMFSIMKITLLSDSKIRQNIVSTLFSHTIF
jgi:hypothetical protein